VPRLKRALRLLLAVALLCAQQAALAHAVWHAGKKESQPAQQLCSYHCAMDSVAGAVDAPVAPPRLAAPEDTSFESVIPSVARAPGITPASRGPPTVS
jgi:hypothetical protein